MSSLGWVPQHIVFRWALLLFLLCRLPGGFSQLRRATRRDPETRRPEGSGRGVVGTLLPAPAHSCPVQAARSTPAQAIASGVFVQFPPGPALSS